MLRKPPAEAGSRSPSRRAVWREKLGGRRLWAVGIGSAVTCGVLVSLASLFVLMMPVSLVTRNLNLDRHDIAFYGSVREGRAELEGGYRIDWRMQAGLFSLGGPVRVTGGDTRLTGQMQLDLSGASLAGLQGRIGAGFVAAFLDRWRCDREVQVQVREASFGWGWVSRSASGEATITPGRCRHERGREVVLPGLELRLGRDGTDAVATLSTYAQEPVLDLRLRQGRMLDLVIQPAAGAILPQLPRGGPMQLTFGF